LGHASHQEPVIRSAPGAIGMKVTVQRGGFVWDVSMAGPIVAISFKLN
jgi:hypothetical protein